MNKIFEKIKSFFKANSEIINPTAVLAIICVVVTLALSSTYMLTYKIIENLRIETQKNAMEKVMKGEYEEITEKVGKDEITYSVVSENGKIIGYIFTTSAKGYGGDISVMTAVDTNGAVVAVEILEAADETPGLGQNVTKKDFYGQFAGLKNGISVVKGGSANKESNEVNAVSGATISSTAVTNAVNQALSYAEQIMAKGD